MSDEIQEVVDNLRADLKERSWLEHAQNMLITTGVLAFGVALGVKWAAVDTINQFKSIGGPFSPTSSALEILAGTFNHHITVALSIAAFGLVGGVLLINWVDGDE